MTNRIKQQYVLIHWRDATMNDHNQCSRKEAESGYTLIDGVVAGFLIKEDKEKVVVALDWFPKDDQFRQIAVYPKSGITSIKRFTLKPVKNLTNKNG